MPTYVTHDEGIINVAKIDFESQSSVLIDADNGTLTIEGEGVFVNAPTGNIDIESINGSIKLGENLKDGQSLKIGKNGATEMIFSPHGTNELETITLTNTSGTATGAIQLNAAAGGIDMDAIAGKNVDISGGKVLLSSKDDAAGAINLTTNIGASETIVVTNTQGTGTSAITLKSAAGGVNIEATSQLASTISIPVIASGGVTDMTDIIRLNEVKHTGIEGVIIGRALYEGSISLEQAQQYIDQN